MEQKKLNTNSNVYTIVYAIVIVVIVALLLAFTSGALKHRQNMNVALDKQKQILAALNVETAGQDAAKLFDDIIENGLLINAEGKVLENDRDKAFNTDIKKQNALPREQRELPVFVASIDGSTKYVLPMTGAGLWGGIWGYIALNEDRNEIYGVFFNHESETPGLGAEIKKPEFQHRFIGKHILDKNGNVGVAVTKNGAAPEEGAEHVDAISGATITSKGVEAMLQGLSQYENFLKEKE